MVAPSHRVSNHNCNLSRNENLMTTLTKFSCYQKLDFSVLICPLNYLYLSKWMIY